MFGDKLKAGLLSLPLLESVTHTLITEEDLEEVMTNLKQSSSTADMNYDVSLTTCSSCDQPSESMVCEICYKAESIKRKREDSFAYLE